MGCWNGTCGLSQLPIGHGDDVVCFIIEQKSEGIGGGINGFCYSTDIYAPLIIPVFGKYNDYGSVEDIEPGSSDIIVEFFNSELNKSIFCLKDHYDREDDEDIHEQNPFIDVENLIGNIERGQVYQKNNRYIDNTEYRATFGLFMVHKAIYDKVMTNFKARIPYGKEEAIYRLMYEKTLSKITKDREPLDPDSFKAIMRDFDIDRMFSYDDAKVNSKLYRYINNNLSLSNIDFASIITDFRCFGSCMSFMRKLFIPQAGAGSQSFEYALHMAMFDGIKEILKKEENDRKEWCEEDEEELGSSWMEETVWF